jgi:hypothetical protein
MANEEERLEILRMIERGDITPEEGMRLMHALSGGRIEEKLAIERTIDVANELSITDEIEDDEAAMPEEPEVDEPAEDIPVAPAQVVKEETQPETDARFARWKRWWILPMSVGAVITVISAFWMYQGYQNHPFGWGFWLSWIPFLIGVGLMTLAAMSSTARWLHVRVKQKPGQKPAVIAISMPLPFGLIKLVMRLFGHRIPQVKGQNIAEMVDMLDQNLSNDAPFYVHVDDEDGEQVEVFIG